MTKPQITKFKSANGKTVYKVKRKGNKLFSAVNRLGKTELAVMATKCALRKAKFKLSVQSEFMKKEGFKNRINNSLGERNGKASTKNQTFANRRNEEKGMRKKRKVKASSLFFM